MTTAAPPSSETSAPADAGPPPYDVAARRARARAAVRATAPRRQPRGIPRPGGPGGWATLRSLSSRTVPSTTVFAEIARVYPRIAHVRIGREHVYFLNHPDLVLEVYHAHGRDTIKGRGLQQIRSLLGDGLLTTEGDHHQRQRRLVQPAFHRARMAGYAEQMVAAAVDHEAGWADGRRVDLAADMSALTLDVVGRTLFGGALRGGPREVGEPLDVLLDGFPTLMLPASQLLLRLPLPVVRRMDAAAVQLDRVVARTVAEHRASGDTGDLLSMLMAAREDGEGMDEEQLRDEVLTLVLAGHETTAMLLTWTWWLLALNPAAAAGLHAELDGALGGRAPAFADVPSLPYTRAVVAESLRLYPPAWTLGRRLTRDLEVDGWLLPAGSQVIASQWVLHRDPRFWDSALAYRPERWLTADGGFTESAPGQPRGAWFPFGWGSRRCVGDQFALAEAVLVLATLAQRWAPEPRPGHHVDVAPAVTLRPRGGLPATLRRR